MTYRKTIRTSIEIEGIGLHSGSNTRIILSPVNDTTGITFHTTNGTHIKALYNRVSNTTLCTTLSVNEQSIHTVEHLMAALYITGITDVDIYIHGNEVPILDGSSKQFVHLIHRSGFEYLNQKKQSLKVVRPVTIETSNSVASFVPSNMFTISASISFRKPIGSQVFKYPSELSVVDARTFALEEDVEKLFRMGLALGGSLKNSIVFSENGVLNKTGLRYKDEPIRHKVLDIIGDLYLAGYPIVASYTGIKPSHYINNLLLKKLFENKNNFVIV